MKLNALLKSKIDKYFNNISPEELYSVLTEKYNFIEDNDSFTDKLNYFTQTEIYSEQISYGDVNYEQKHYIENIKTKSIGSNEDLSLLNDKKSSLPLAA